MDRQATQADVLRSVEDPRLGGGIDILGSLNILSRCRRFGVRRVIFVSAGGAVCEGTTRHPTPEGHARRPAWRYGFSKLAAEHPPALLERPLQGPCRRPPLRKRARAAAKCAPRE